MSTTQHAPRNDKAATKYVVVEFPFKMLLMAGWMWGAYASYDAASTSWLGSMNHPVATHVLAFVGMAIAAYQGVAIYFQRFCNDGRLITDGLFRYTRHPMYTGFAFTAFDIWWPTENIHTVGYWASLAMFLVGLVVAGYIQELETLALFGKEAEEYYERTPRLFFFYPFM